MTIDSNWLSKELDSLKTSSLRLALLMIIILFQDEGGIYGYKISEKLLEYTGIDASNATYYAVLRRLKKDKLIESKLKESDQGPARKHYFPTNDGIKVCNELFESWGNHLDRLSELKGDVDSTTKTGDNK